MKRSSLTSASNEAGFTLLEILIAISILAFITVIVVNITQNASDTMERTSEVNKNNLQIETAMSRFEWDFSQIYSPLYFSSRMQMPQGGAYGGGGVAGGDVGGADAGGGGQALTPELQNYYDQLNMRFQQNEHFVGVSKEGLPIPRFFAPEKDVFEFYTSSNRRKVENTKQSNFAWVRYALETQEEDPQKERPPGMPTSLRSLVRYFTADDPYNPKRINPEDDKVKGAVLLQNVEALEFQFWDPARKKWDTGLRSIQNGESILRGIRIILTWYDDTGNKRTAERVFRNLWPANPPQDPVSNTGGGAAGASGGVAAGANAGANAGADGGSVAGVNGGAAAGVNGGVAAGTSGSEDGEE